MDSKLLRPLALLPIIAVCVALAGCGGQSGTTSSTPAGNTSAATGTASTPTTSSSSSTVTETATATATATPTTSSSTSTSTTTTASTTTPSSGGQTSTTCTGTGCQPNGTQTVPGSISPTNGKCPSGYIYLPPQDNGPALCIPKHHVSQQSSTTTPSNG